MVPDLQLQIAAVSYEQTGSVKYTFCCSIRASLLHSQMYLQHLTMQYRESSAQDTAEGLSIPLYTDNIATPRLVQNLYKHLHTGDL
jgi:hypothetical protein